MNPARGLADGRAEVLELPGGLAAEPLQGQREAGLFLDDAPELSRVHVRD